MAEGTGFALNLDASFLNILTEADKKLEKVVKHTEDMAKAMNKLSGDGLKSIVDGLSRMETSLGKLSKSKGFSNMNAQAAQSVDAINKLIVALANLKAQQDLRLQTQQAKLDYKKQANDVKELTVAENERARALDRQNKANAANDKHQQALLTKQLANDTKELMNKEQERGRQLILQNQKNIAAYTKESVKIKQQIQEIERLAKAYRQMPKSIKQGELNKLITGASKAKTINQHIVAIHNLNNALRDLDTRSKKYKDNVRRINEEIARNRMELAKLGVNLDNTRKKKRQLMDTAGQLGRSLALLFSVSHVVGYLNKLVNIRREMELQHKSLQVLLQDRYEADKLWQQTVDLAVRSPFRVKELVTYTRQLAAYRIETDNLHETTKRLADVSAGLGVDMNRLILAYGQVRAAEYLRGTELRQFSEAGIPMLDELAKLFSELENRAVSAGDVFERVSKRMVSFEDVAEVFRRMTNEGGVFFQMQEKQSETLHGIISNLHDSIDLMLNDLGEAQDGLLKGTVLTLRSFVENWRVFAEILTQLGTVATILYLRKGLLKLLALSPKIYAMAGSLASFNVVSRALNISIIRFAGSLKALGAAMLTPQGIIIGLVATLASSISAFIAYQKAIDATNEKYDELSEREVDSMRKLEALNNKIQENNDKIKKNNEVLNDNNKSKEEQTKATKDNEKALKDNDKILGELQQKYPEIYNGLKRQEDGTIDVTNAIEQQNEMLRINIALQQQAKGDFWSQDFSKNYQQALGAYQNTVKDIVNIQSQANRSMVNLSNLVQNGGMPQNIYDQLDNLLKQYGKTNSYEGISELAKQLNNISTNLNYSLDNKTINNIRDAFEPLTEAQHKLFLDQKTYLKYLDDWYENIDEQISSFDVGVQKIIGANPDKKLASVLAGDWITKELEKLGTTNQELMRRAQERVKNQLTVQVAFEEDGEPTYNLSEVWRQKVWDAIQTVEKTNPEIRLGVTMKEMATKDKSELLKKVRDNVENAIKVNNETIEVGEISVQTVYTDEQIQQAKDAQPLLDFLGQLVGLIEKSSRVGQGKDWISEAVKSVRDAHKEYLSLNKTLDAASARQMTLAKYADLFREAAQHTQFKGMSLEDFDFTTEAGTILALETMLDALPESAKNARLTIQKTLKDITGERTIRLKVEEDKALIDQIEDMFSGYEMSIELQKLNIPPDLAKQLFGIDNIDLSSIREKIQSELSAAKTIGGQEDRVKELEKQLEKVDELEDKQLKERLKKYSKYLVTAMGERVKIKMEEVRQINEIENLKELTPAQEKLAKQGVRQESQAQLDKLELEEFKDSGMYVQLFEDLEYASTLTLKNMRMQLRNLGNSLKNLDADDLKHLSDQIEKLDKELASRNPFKKMVTGIDDYVNAVENSKEAERNLIREQSLYNQQKSIVEFDEEQLAKKRAQYEIASQNLSLTDEQHKQYQKEINDLEISLELGRDFLSLYKSWVDTAQKEVDNNNEIKKTFKESLGEVGQYITEAANALPQVAGDLENVFGTMSAGTKDTIDSISTIAGGVGSAIQGFASGNYIQAIAGVAQAIGGIVAIGDKKKERQIQREIKFVEDLEKAYEKLEKQIDEAYSIDTLQRSGKQAKANLEDQIDSYERMIAAEEDKKKTDKDRIKEWENTIEDIREQIDELNKELVSTATGGIMDDVLSAAQEFTNAWLEAFNETEDGLSGLEDNFKETMLEMVKQQASMLITQAYVDKWKKELEKYINPDDLNLTTAEAGKWVDTVTSSLPQLNEALENYFTSMKQAGVDLGGESGELSGLQRGIASASEATMQAVEAYLSSIRFFVAEQNTYLAQIAANFGNTEIENPMVSQLRIIAQQTTAINTLLNSLTSGGHSMGGRGFRVFIS